MLFIVVTFCVVMLYVDAMMNPEGNLNIAEFLAVCVIDFGVRGIIYLVKTADHYIDNVMYEYHKNIRV